MTSPDQCRGFGQLLVDGDHRKRRERLYRELDLVDETEIFVDKRFGENFSESDGRCDSAQAMTFQPVKYRIEEIGVGPHVLDK